MHQLTAHHHRKITMQAMIEQSSVREICTLQNPACAESKWRGLSPRRWPCNVPLCGDITAREHNLVVTKARSRDAGVLLASGAVATSVVEKAVLNSMEDLRPRASEVLAHQHWPHVEPIRASRPAILRERCSCYALDVGDIPVNTRGKEQEIGRISEGFQKDFRRMRCTATGVL
eukprot:SAG11_NODE_4134_length_2046_cov_1.347714_1_plen_174_part_00